MSEMPTNGIHRLGAAGLGATILLAAASGTAPVPATGSRIAASAKIAFVSTPRGGGPLSNATVYVVNADGSGKRRLATGVWPDTPSWSPDGRKLAFVRGTRRLTDNTEIYVMNADGSGKRRLTRNAGSDIFPVWSPGRKIAFVRGRGGGRVRFESDLYVMNADGSGQRRLARDAGPAAWSPDGRKLVFGAGLQGIYVANADGSGLRRLTSNPGDTYTVWSPDGRKLAFVRSGRCLRCPANAKLYVMNADGSGQRRLAYAEGINAPPSWSPDGQKIAFERSQRTNPKTPSRRFLYRTEIDVMNVDGSGRRRLTYGGRPLWSPDGRKIAFFTRRGGNRELYVMNPDGSGQRNLSRNPGAHDDLFVWAPVP